MNGRTEIRELQSLLVTDLQRFSEFLGQLG